MQLLILILLPFVGSVLAGLLPANTRNREAWLAALIALAGVLITASLYPAVAAGEVIRYRLAWLPQLGLDFTLRMDGFAWLFAMLVLGVGLLVVLYARYYMAAQDPLPRFFAFLLAFMGAMLGIVLAGNLIQLVLFWELTSLASFLLIGYWQHRADARRGARMAFTVTCAGGLCLFAGVLLIGHIVGSYDLDVVLASGDTLRDHAWYLPTLILIALGALTKSAQFPFHFWLPHAMAAPTPVSAYLHSATMVKAGVFLLTRLWPVLAGTEEWFWIIGGTGLCTLLLGAFLAIFQHDLKGLLAYSTISHLGLITLLLGIGTPLAAAAAIFHTINHATFKASLFMAAGIIDHETGTRDLRRLSGLYQAMPITATLALVACAAMAGVPLLNGFLSKEMFFAEAALVGSTQDWSMAIAATIAGMFSVAYSIRFMHEVFFGPPALGLPSTPHEPPRWMRFPIELLVLACVLVGIVPALTIGPFLRTAAASVLGARLPDYDLAIWHGFTLPLLMSVVALLGGALLYLLLVRYLRLRTRDREPVLHRFDGKRVFERGMLGLTTAAGRIESLLGTRRLQPQLLVIVLTAGVAALLPLSARGLAWGPQAPLPLDPVFTLGWAIGMACAIGAAWQAKYHRLAALSLLGGAGLMTCLTFVWFSAPDLALTQLMVETVTMVLILLGLRWLPARTQAQAHAALVRHSASPRQTLRRARFRRIRDLGIAIGVGGGIAALSYAVLTRPLPPSISAYFLAHALPDGGGSNVVNVILVDFRGFDTLGEISVLSIVALTVYALLRRFRPAPESIPIPNQQLHEQAEDEKPNRPSAEQAESGYLLVPGVFMRLLLPIMGMVAVFFVLRGHNAPGGGFVGGLIMAVAIILQYMVGGTAWFEARTRMRPQRWLGAGLLLAALTGAGAWLAGYPFLTSHTAHLRLPWLGAIEVPSAFAFDLGVFTVVVGSTVLILIALAHQSIRSHRIPGAVGGGEALPVATTTTPEVS